MKNNPYICSVKLLKSETMEQVFEPTRVITPDAMPIPKTGHVGYVHIENPYDYATLNPTWTDVDMDEGEADC